jgi:hypothetical protein
MSTSSISVRRQFRLSEIEFEIRRMEVELDFHHEQAKLIEEAIHERQSRLERLQLRLRPSGITGDDHDSLPQV